MYGENTNISFFPSIPLFRNKSWQPRDLLDGVAETPPHQGGGGRGERALRRQAGRVGKPFFLLENFCMYACYYAQRDNYAPTFYPLNQWQGSSHKKIGRKICSTSDRPNCIT